MLNTLAAKIVALAAPAPGAGGLDTQGIVSWLATNILPLGFCVLGIITLIRARKGDMAKTANTIGVALIAVIMFGGAAAFFAFGNQMVGVMFK